MVTMPLALLLGFGLFMSLKGKGTPWCAFLALALGMTLASTQIGAAVREVVEAAISAAITTGSGVTG